MEEIGYGGKLRGKSVMEENYGGTWLWRKATEEIGYVTEETYVLGPACCHI